MLGLSPGNPAGIKYHMEDLSILFRMCEVNSLNEMNVAWWGSELKSKKRFNEN